MNWVEYARDQSLLAKEIYRKPMLLWTDPDKFEKSESGGEKVRYIYTSQYRQTSKQHLDLSTNTNPRHRTKRVNPRK